MKLLKAFKKKWIEALRSGKYEQGISRLKFKAWASQPTYCCLGVAKEIWPGLHKAVNGDELLRESSCRKISLDPEIQKKLAGFNDNGKSFNWIASYIERYL